MSNEIKSVLFSYWDGGTGHLTRTMALAKEAKKKGIEVGFISSEKYASWISNDSSDYVVYTIPNRNPNVTPPSYQFPIYSHAFRHAQRLKGLRFDDIEWLHQTVEQEIKVLKEFKPDIVINDYRDTVKIGSEVLGIPVVALTKSTGHPDGYTFGWWITPPSDLILPDCRDSFNEVRQKYGLSPIQDEREMFTGNISLIPSIKEIDPLLKKHDNTHYVGALSYWWRKNQENFQAIPHNIPKVYSYIGEKSRPQYGYESLLSQVIQSLPDIGFYVVGDPKKYNASGLDQPKKDKRIIIKDYLPAKDIIPQSSVVLSHGGSGTTLLALSQGVPLVFVGPFTTEQMTTAKWVEKEGAGIIIPHSNRPLDRIAAPDLGEGVEIMGHWNSEITPESISKAINEVISNKSYDENAKRLAASINSIAGSNNVFDLINKLM